MTAVALYYHYLNHAGGAERMICQLACELTKRNLKVHLISLDAMETPSYYPISKDVTWHRLGHGYGIKDKTRRTRLIARILRHNGIGILIGFVMSGDKTVYAASLLGGAKLVAAERNGPAMYRLRFGLIKRWLCFALLHLCHSITVQFPRYQLAYPLTLRRRVKCISNPVEKSSTKARPEAPGIDGRYRLLTVSRLDLVQKRLDCLIQSFARIKNSQPQWDLFIIGDGPDARVLRQMISSLGLADRITIKPPTETILTFYSSANLFVLPSRWEGFPNALAEALSTGLPAVGFREAEGVADLIKEGKTGWLAEPGEEIESLAAALTAAMSDDEERHVRGARAIVEMQQFVPKLQYDKWQLLIYQLAGETPA